jgi:hypothetical protein
LNRYNELIVGCWRLFICYNPKYIKLKSVEFECKGYEPKQ